MSTKSGQLQTALFPALVYIFGGGWGYYSANRRQCDNIIQTAASKGYVAVTVDYRLTNVKENGKTKFPFPNQLYDVKSAVRWLRANAEKYNINPDRIGVVGWSSGGHLALLVGLTDASDNLRRLKWQQHLFKPGASSRLHGRNG